MIGTKNTKLSTRPINVSFLYTSVIKPLSLLLINTSKKWQAFSSSINCVLFFHHPYHFCTLSWLCLPPSPIRTHGNAAVQGMGERPCWSGRGEALPDGFNTTCTVGRQHGVLPPHRPHHALVECSSARHPCLWAHHSQERSVEWKMNVLNWCLVWGGIPSPVVSSFLYFLLGYHLPWLSMGQQTANIRIFSMFDY